MSWRMQGRRIQGYTHSEFWIMLILYSRILCSGPISQLTRRSVVYTSTSSTVLLGSDITAQVGKNVVRHGVVEMR